MIMEHMHLLERRQGRSFILIAQWHLIFDPQTNLKCKVSLTEDGSVSPGAKIPSNLSSRTFVRVAKNRAL